MNQNPSIQVTSCGDEECACPLPCCPCCPGGKPSHAAQA